MTYSKEAAKGAVVRRDSLEDENGSLAGNPRETTAVGGFGSTGEVFKVVAGDEKLEMVAID